MSIPRIGRVMVKFAMVIGVTMVTGHAVGSATPEHSLSSTDSVGDGKVSDQAVIAAVTRDLCGRQVVLLGENGFHGDGKTLAFKVALVQRLVDKCGFNAVFFESSHYDFLAFGRALRSAGQATPAMLSSAVGGLWNQSLEFTPLVPYLFGKARSGQVVLGGLDDQLGTRGSFYSLERMPKDLASYLSSSRRLQCQEWLRRRIWSDFPPEKLYSQSDRFETAKCLAEIRIAISVIASRERRKQEDLAMVASFERAIARDFEDPAVRNSVRDRSMYSNFLWLSQLLPKPAKVIVWSANEHVARDASSAPSFGQGRNLGFLVRQAYGVGSFALGFSAASGSFRWSSREIRVIPPASAVSVEGKSLAGSRRNVVYVNSAQLHVLGSAPSAIFSHQYLVAPWGGVFDGAVVFRQERPPTRLPPAQTAPLHRSRG